MKRRILLFPALLGMLACTGGVPADVAAPPESRTNGFSELSSAYVAMAIQGDLRRAPALFERSVGGGAAGAALKTQFGKRFVEPRPTSGASSADVDLETGVAESWRAYWRRNLMREMDESAAGEALTHSLLELVATPANVDASHEDLTREALKRAGLHFSLAATPPWRDLFAWKRQRQANYRVELTDATMPVEVVFMDDFVIQGWKDFASLGLATTTGWVEGGRLYCVAWAYDTNSENFAVSYLKHEARHLADLERFPDMDPVELEYRAKLTELAFANRELERIWRDFRAKSADNPDAPHAQANWRVVRDMERRLESDEHGHQDLIDGRMDVRHYNRAARDLLKANTAAHLQGNRAVGR